jgi:hypothetical protein
MRASHAALIAIAVLVAAPGGSALQGPPGDRLAWQLSSGPFTGNVKALVQSESGTVFALANSELYRSVDDGTTWQRCESQPVHQFGVVQFNPWLATIAGRLYSSADPGSPLYASVDECVTSRTFPEPPQMGRGLGEGITVVNGTLIASTGSGLFALKGEQSMLRGAVGTWTPLAIPAGGEPRAYGRERTWFLVAGQRLFRSTDDGTTWQRLAPEDMRFSSVVTGGTSLWATASGGVWRSADGGETWSRMIESGLTALIAKGRSVHVAVFDPLAIMRSADDGASWTTRAEPAASARLETSGYAAGGRRIFRRPTRPGREGLAARPAGR